MLRRIRLFRRHERVDLAVTADQRAAALTENARRQVLPLHIGESGRLPGETGVVDDISPLGFSPLYVKIASPSKASVFQMKCLGHSASAAR